METKHNSPSHGLPLLDRVAIVTGSARGIGKAIALHLASLGAKIVINYVSPSSEAVAQELVSTINISHHSNTPRAIMVQADVSDEAQVQRLFDTAERAFQTQPHIVVTNAGVLDSKYPTLAETDLADFDRTYAVNVRGTFLCIKEAAKRVKRGGGGRIVTFSSSLAASFLTRYGAYTASNAAVEAMTKILSKELKGTKITANCVAPGPIATELQFEGKSEEWVQKMIENSPIGRLGTPEDVASLVGYVVTDAAELLNGHTIRINGGYV